MMKVIYRYQIEYFGVTLMVKKVALFLEDDAHEKIICAIVRKIAKEKKVDVELTIRTATGGHPKVVKELELYFRLMDKHGLLHDLLIVATDANCDGYIERMKKLKCDPALALPEIVYAVPDPHIEHWLMIDSVAFKKVFGKGCTSLKLKCERRKYKQAYIKAMQAADHKPLTSIDFAEEIIDAMNIPAMPADPSFKAFVTDLRKHL